MFRFLRGDRHVRRIEENLSGGDGHERRIIYPVTTIVEQALSDIRSVRMLARASADERSRDSGTLSEDSVRRESRALIAAARHAGCLLEASSVPGSRYTIRSGESEVRLVQKDQLYYKIKNPFAKLHLKKHPAEYVLFEHIVHNVMFPDCRLDFLGVVEDLHDARIVYRQHAVRSEIRPDDGQISVSLSELGLKPENRYSFGNEYVFVTDVGQDGDNVLVDDDGFLRFIDPIIGFKLPLQKYLANIDALEKTIPDIVCKILDRFE